ncbi:hypothetical protein F5B19DRAFT_346046 [Rostrohypoxylon terebratum]|nr:hypothetical protein F5B19DRAFT_346046 [Rostrohypoxylon terebratum]
MTSALLPPSTRRKLDESIPPLLRPLIRAYVLGYASAVAPRLLTLVLQYVTRRKNKGVASAIRPHDSFITSLQRILRGGLELQRFPTFCAALVGGTTLLEVRPPIIGSYLLFFSHIFYFISFELYSRRHLDRSTYRQCHKGLKLTYSLQRFCLSQLLTAFYPLLNLQR